MTTTWREQNEARRTAHQQRKRRQLRRIALIAAIAVMALAVAGCLANLL